MFPALEKKFFLLKLIWLTHYWWVRKYYFNNTWKIPSPKFLDGAHIQPPEAPIADSQCLTEEVHSIYQQRKLLEIYKWETIDEKKRKVFIPLNQNNTWWREVVSKT